jgi:hypothetical protein
VQQEIQVEIYNAPSKASRDLGMRFFGKLQTFQSNCVYKGMEKDTHRSR